MLNIINNNNFLHPKKLFSLLLLKLKELNKIRNIDIYGDQTCQIRVVYHRKK